MSTSRKLRKGTKQNFEGRRFIEEKKRSHRYTDRRSKGMISGKGSFTRRRVSGRRERIEERGKE